MLRYQAQCFVLSEPPLAIIQLSDHLFVSRAFPKALEVIVDAAVEIELDASRTWLELAWRSGYNIASQL